MVNARSTKAKTPLSIGFLPPILRRFLNGPAKAIRSMASKTSIGIIMGSQSDWPTLKAAADMLDALGLSYESRIVSAHRTPDRMADYAKTATERGLKVIIAGAGGAAHLPGMVASMTTLPVLGVPVQSRALKGLDSLLSIAQMPGGVPVATFAIGEAGAKNAALHAAAILALSDAGLKKRLDAWRTKQTKSVAKKPK
jgi:5-(carboxyamino)imidazole ribonucleotide mutase